MKKLKLIKKHIAIQFGLTAIIHNITNHKIGNSSMKKK
jgi:hypothetical protein